MNNFFDSDYKVGIYLRLSNEDSNKYKNDESESIKNQRLLLLSEIKKRKNFVFVDEYCDENLSGVGDVRPEFNRLINDCKKGKINLVLCKSQSRFSRDIETIEKYLYNKFILWGVRFISVVDNVDTLNKSNKKSSQINGLINEWYLEDLSNNIRSALYVKMKSGQSISSFAPFGYKKINKNKIIVDTYASSIVKNIFTMYLSGKGFKGIAKYLNEKNIPSPAKYKFYNGEKINIVSAKKKEQLKWSANAVKNILMNEVYIGNLIQGKRTTISYKNHQIIKKNPESWIRVENTHESIIKKETFYQVQNLIQKKHKPSRNNCEYSIFSKLVYCDTCGSVFKKKNSLNYTYLVCQKSQSEYDYCSNYHSIRFDYLEQLVLSSINKRIKHYIDYDYLKKMFNNYQKNEITKKIEELKIQLCNLKRQKDKNIQTIKSFMECNTYKLDSSFFTNLINDYLRINNQVDIQIKSVINKIKYIKENQLKNNFFSEDISKNIPLKKLNLFVIQTFINKIIIGDVVDKKRNVYIIWNDSL